MVLYFKDICHTLDSWRSGVNKDGWKLSLEGLKGLNIIVDHEISYDLEVSLKIETVSRLKSDLIALGGLLAG